MSFQPGNKTPLVSFNRFHSLITRKLTIDMEFPPDSDMTDQSFAQESDINVIMARYQSTGELPVLNGIEGQWLDVTEMDFQEHMNFMVEAQNMFDQLPSAIRDRFGNDPGAFLGFSSNPDNELELAKMGLLTEVRTRELLDPQYQLEQRDRANPPTDGA